MFTTCGYGENKTQHRHKFCIFSTSAKICPSQIKKLCNKQTVILLLKSTVR